jgi:O-glycosyl hydrolase
MRNVVVSLLLWICLTMPSIAQALPSGASVLPPDALLTTPVGGLTQTQAAAQVVPVTGEPFSQALRVTIRTNSPDTNITQLTMRVPGSVTKGDVLAASFFVRGAAKNRKSPAQAMFLFERAMPPWRSSIALGVTAAQSPNLWRRVVIPFTASEDYPANVAQVSLRFAFGPQTIEVGGLNVVNYGTSMTFAALTTLLAQENPLGTVRVTVLRSQRHQTLLGLGGDFCQPRYGDTNPMDAVGAYNLSHLHVAQARVGIPLNDWAPQRGVYSDTGPAHAALLQMQLLTRRHIPIIGSVWEGPSWMLPGGPDQGGQTLAPSEYGDCIEAIAQFLVTARDHYGVTVADFSFNEANYGVNFLFTPAQITAFIQQAGPRLRALGLKTQFLVGDTTGGMPLPDYARPILADSAIAPFLGPIAFHCWDALGASENDYTQIAALGHEFHKPIWCTESGFDAQLWQKPDPWASWDNGLQTARAYVKTLRLTGASVMDYWTYQNNYSLVNPDTSQPYPVFFVVKQMQDALPKESCVVATDTQTDRDDLGVLATVGPASQQFSVVLVNAVGAGRVTLTGLPADRKVSVIISDSAGQDKVLTPPMRVTASGTLALSLPARSVVTVSGK